MYIYMYVYVHITYTHKYYLQIIPNSGALAGPIPRLLIIAIVTLTEPLNTPSGSNGTANVSIVVELLTFITIISLLKIT